MRIRRAVWVSLCAVVLLSVSALSGTADGSGLGNGVQINDTGYSLVWSDSFDGDKLNTNVWTREWSTYGDGNNELQCYRPESVAVEDGSLKLQAFPWYSRCPDGERRNYSSGMVRSRFKLDFTYGRFEVDAQVPAGQGLWPAAWMSPAEYVYGGWPDSGEMDIFEIRGHEPNRVVGSAHWKRPDGRHRLDNGDYWLPEGSFADGVHTYAMEWTPYSITWSVDGIPYNWLVLSDLETSAGYGGPPFDEAFYLKLNLSVGGNWIGHPDNVTQWPAEFRIEEIRVYQKG